MLKSPRQKGANGEREVIELLLEWLHPVYAGAGKPLPTLSRNLEQVRAGGYDLVGIPWLALEVKRQEVINLGSWWAQTLASASEGQIPMLLWRQNRRPWAARVRLWVHHRPTLLTELDVDMSYQQAKTWFQYETWSRLQEEA